MPLRLTTPLNPGSFANDGPYTHIKIVRYDCDLTSKEVYLHLRFGTIVDGKFVVGELSQGRPKVIVLNNMDTVEVEGSEEPIGQFDRLLSDNEEAYEAVKAGLYQELIDNHSYAGTIV